MQKIYPYSEILIRRVTNIGVRVLEYLDTKSTAEMLELSIKVAESSSSSKAVPRNI